MCLSDCAISDKNGLSRIIFTHNKCILLINNNIYKAWTKVGDTFLCLKDPKQSIIMFEFLLPFGHLNIFS